MRESKIEQYLCMKVTAVGGIHRKAQWIGHRGAPDRWCGFPSVGRAAWVEVKRPLTPNAEAHQAREHARLRACGERVFVCATTDDVDAFIEAITHPLGYGRVEI